MGVKITGKNAILTCDVEGCNNTLKLQKKTCCRSEQ